MEKIPSLLNADGAIDPAHDWILSGHGTATRMWDGVCYSVIDGQPYQHIITVQLAPDMLLSGLHNGHFWGWQPVPASDHLFWACWKDNYEGTLDDWSYELIGNLINGDPEGVQAHVFRPHGKLTIQALKRPTVDTTREYLSTHDIEGVVWWENIWDLDCRKVKVQQKDFNLKRNKRSH